MNDNKFAILSKFNENEIEQMINWNSVNVKKIVNDNFLVLTTLFPLEIWLLIFSFLNLKSLCKLIMTTKFFSIDFFPDYLFKNIIFMKTIHFNCLKRILIKGGDNLKRKILIAASLNKLFFVKEVANDTIKILYIESILTNNFTDVEFILNFFQIWDIKMSDLIDYLKKKNLDNLIEEIKNIGLKTYCNFERLCLENVMIDPLVMSLLINNLNITKLILKHIEKIIIKKELQFQFPLEIFTYHYSMNHCLSSWIGSANDFDIMFLGDFLQLFNSKEILKLYDTIEQISKRNRKLKLDNLNSISYLSKYDFYQL